MPFISRIILFIDLFIILFLSRPLERAPVPLIERSVPIFAPPTRHPLPPPPQLLLPNPPPLNINHIGGRGNVVIIHAPAPVPQAVPVTAEVVGAEGDEVELVEEEGDEVEAADGKRTRGTRKFTFWNFVDKIPGGSDVFCKCDCLDKNNGGVLRVRYAAPNTGAIKRHVEKHHPALFAKFEACKERKGNLNELFEEIDRLDGVATEKATKRRRKSDSFWSKATNLEKEVTSNLRLLAWAISCGVSRNALNDILFDSYHKSLGAPPPSNRHLLQDSYLPAFDELVRASIIESLKKASSVSLSSDGWRDRSRRDWINIVVQWIGDSSNTPKKWDILVVEPDLIFLPSSATSDTIAYLIDDSLESFVLHLFIPSTFVSCLTLCSLSSTLAYNQHSYDLIV